MAPTSRPKRRSEVVQASADLTCLSDSATIPSKPAATGGYEGDKTCGWPTQRPERPIHPVSDVGVGGTALSGLLPNILLCYSGVSGILVFCKIGPKDSHAVTLRLELRPELRPEDLKDGSHLACKGSREAQG